MLLNNAWWIPRVLPHYLGWPLRINSTIKCLTGKVKTAIKSHSYPVALLLVIFNNVLISGQTSNRLQSFIHPDILYCLWQTLLIHITPETHEKSRRARFLQDETKQHVRPQVSVSFRGRLQQYSVRRDTGAAECLYWIYLKGDVKTQVSQRFGKGIHAVTGLNSIGSASRPSPVFPWRPGVFLSGNLDTVDVQS